MGSGKPVPLFVDSLRDVALRSKEPNLVRSEAMSRRLTITDELYDRLEREAKRRGLERVEDLLDLLLSQAGSTTRDQVVGRIDDLRAELTRKYGQFPDCAESVREDRSRATPNLEALLKRVNKENRHGEMSTGPPVGNEEW